MHKYFDFGYACHISSTCKHKFFRKYILIHQKMRTCMGIKMMPLQCRAAGAGLPESAPESPGQR